MPETDPYPNPNQDSLAHRQAYADDWHATATSDEDVRRALARNDEIATERIAVAEHVDTPETTAQGATPEAEPPVEKPTSS